MSISEISINYNFDFGAEKFDWNLIKSDIISHFSLGIWRTQRKLDCYAILWLVNSTTCSQILSVLSNMELIYTEFTFTGFSQKQIQHLGSFSFWHCLLQILCCCYNKISYHSDITRKLISDQGNNKTLKINELNKIWLALYDLSMIHAGDSQSHFLQLRWFSMSFSTSFYCWIHHFLILCLSRSFQRR